MNQVYVELVLLDNFLMDYLLLHFALRFSEKRVFILRAAAGAGIGALYAVFAVIFPFLTLLPIKLLMSIVMCIAARGLRHFKALAYTVVAFIILSFLFGGAILAAMYAVNGYVSGAFINLPVLRYLLIGGAVACVALELILRRPKVKPNEDYLIKAQILGETVELSAILDTGNDLKDLAGGGVIVADLNAVIRQVSDSVKKEIKAYPHSSKLIMRPFTYSSIGGNGSMPGLLPDKLILKTSDRQYLVKAYIVLSGEISLKGHSALLSSNLRLIPVSDTLHQK
jgi:stage II sporulation protein GA (sporulation sigma-E factor processing peptidase)